MSRFRIRRSDTSRYLIALAIIIVAFLLLGGGAWIKGLTQGGGAHGMAGLQWTQIFISLVVGILIGYLAGRRR